ncbi:hypothetical protein NDU88_004572 [Pleurodeles waltl]|uniref:Uncharacterized protein n=1 Tax=Pleurodeles waltl TaxID=8319 RepID=A0AAV7UJL9_PLEWA|nr:hypothetical protein NDU88_004572 [Pleurodeles waltl]
MGAESSGEGEQPPLLLAGLGRTAEHERSVQKGLSCTPLAPGLCRSAATQELLQARGNGGLSSCGLGGSGVQRRRGCPGGPSWETAGRCSPHLEIPSGCSPRGAAVGSVPSARHGGGRGGTRLLSRAAADRESRAPGSLDPPLPEQSVIRAESPPARERGGGRRVRQSLEWLAEWRRGHPWHSTVQSDITGSSLQILDWSKWRRRRCSDTTANDALCTNHIVQHNSNAWRYTQFTVEAKGLKGLYALATMQASHFLNNESVCSLTSQRWAQRRSADVDLPLEWGCQRCHEELRDHRTAE